MRVPSYFTVGQYKVRKEESPDLEGRVVLRMSLQGIHPEAGLAPAVIPSLAIALEPAEAYELGRDLQLAAHVHG